MKQNKIIKYILMCAVFLIFSGCAAQTQKTPQYDQLEFSSVKELPKPETESFTLGNGIKCFLLEDHELPLIKVKLRIRSGKVEVPEGKEGLAEIAGDAMRSGGSSKYPGKKLNRILENNAANLNISFGLSSGKAGLNVLKKDFPELLPVFVDVLKNPAFPEEKIGLAKQRLNTRISRRNDGQQEIALRKFKKLVYGKESVYSRVPEYETVESVTKSDLKGFQQAAFKGQKMIMGVVGDFDSQDMKKKLQRAFSAFPAGSEDKEFKDEFPQVEDNREKTINLVDKSDVNQSFILIGHKGGIRTNPDYAKLQVMNKILSGGFSGRLFENIRTKQGLAYSVFGRYGCNYYYPGTFFVGLETKSASTKKAIQKVQREIKRLQKNGTDSEELEQAKSQFNNSLVFKYSSSEKIMSRLLHYEYRNMPKDSFQKLVQGIREVSVSDIQEVAEQYIDPERFQILVVGKKSKVYPQLQKLGKVNMLELEP